MAKKYQNSLLGKPVIKDKSLIRHEEIKKKIVVLPELEGLIPPLKEEEFAQLEQNILKEGCREALLVWQRNGQDYVLIDGHNRYKICSAHGLDFRVNLLQFTDMEEARHYMVENQLGRRNLTPEQASYLRGVRYQQEKQGRGQYDRTQMAQNGPNDALPTSERLADAYGVSRNTIKRDAAFASGLDKIGLANPELKRQILSGQLKVKKGDIQLLARSDKLGEIKTGDDLQKALKAPATTSKGSSEKKVQASASDRLKNVEKNLKMLKKVLQTEGPDADGICQNLITELKGLQKLLKGRK